MDLLRTSDQYQIRLSRLFRPYHLTPSSYSILRILRAEGVPLTIPEIAKRAGTVTPRITNLIDRLEEEGFIFKKRCPENRKVVHITLTTKGQTTLSVIDKPLEMLNESSVTI